MDDGSIAHTLNTSPSGDRMERPVDYKVVEVRPNVYLTTSLAEALSNAVRHEVSNGWTPVGGLAISIQHDHEGRAVCVYSQAVVRYEGN